MQAGYMQGGQLSEVGDGLECWPQDPCWAHAGSCIDPWAPASSSGLYGCVQAGGSRNRASCAQFTSGGGMRASVQEIALPAAHLCLLACERLFSLGRVVLTWPQTLEDVHGAVAAIERVRHPSYY